MKVLCWVYDGRNVSTWRARSENIHVSLQINGQCSCFQNIELLKSRPAHLAVFLHHVISQFDPASLVRCHFTAHSCVMERMGSEFPFSLNIYFPICHLPAVLNQFQLRLSPYNLSGNSTDVEDISLRKAGIDLTGGQLCFVLLLINAVQSLVTEASARGGKKCHFLTLWEEFIPVKTLFKTRKKHL